jgi:hypothetical protein
MVGRFDDPTLLLIAAGQAYKVPSILQTIQHPLLMALALKHAQYQADVDRLGHQGFDQRATDIMRQIPGSSPSEIAAVSWGGQTPVEAAADAFKSWKQSPGHWKLCNSAHTYYGYAMALGKQGTYYSVGLFCDVAGVPGPGPEPTPAPTPEPGIGGWFRRLVKRLRG